MVHFAKIRLSYGYRSRNFNQSGALTFYVFVSSHLRDDIGPATSFDHNPPPPPTWQRIKLCYCLFFLLKTKPGKRNRARNDESNGEWQTFFFTDAYWTHIWNNARNASKGAIKHSLTHASKAGVGPPNCSIITAQHKCSSHSNSSIVQQRLCRTK